MTKQQACLNCARSKIRCTWPGGTDTGPNNRVTCHKCARSNLECIVPAPGPRKTRGKSARVKALEQKVDGLVSLLAASNQLQAEHPEAQVPSPAEIEPSTQFKARQQPRHQQQGDEHALPIQIPAPLPTVPSPAPRGALETTAHAIISLTESRHLSQQSIELVPGFRLSFSEADQLLDEYRKYMVPGFPFVPIPHTRRARDMYYEQSLLLKTIICVCRPQSFPIHVATERWLREYFAHHVVVLGEQSLELLQAILVFLAWQEIPYFVEGKETYFIQLATGMAGNLGIHRSSDAPRPPHRSILDDAGLLFKGLHVRQTQSLADRRAILGLFYLTSISSTLFKRVPGLSYTNHLDECCRALQESREYPTDALAVELVRVQHLTNRASAIVAEANTSNNHNPAVFQPSHAMAISTLDRELEEMVGRWPEDLKGHYVLRSHVHVARLRMYEPVIWFKSPILIPGSSSPTRAQTQWDCFLAAKTLFESSLLVHPSDMAKQPFTHMVHLAWAHITLIRLLFLEDPEWDASTARRVANFPDLIQRVSDHFEKCDVASEIRRKVNEDGKGLFLHSAERMRWVKGWYLARVPADTGVEALTPLSQEGATYGFENEQDFEFWPWFFDPMMI